MINPWSKRTITFNPGAPIGKSIENAAANATNQLNDKMLPQMKKMLIGDEPDLLQGAQKIVDQTVPKVMAGIELIAEKSIAKTTDTVRDIVPVVARAVRKEVQQLLSHISFGDEGHSETPDERVFNALRRSFLQHKVKYLDLLALGQGYRLHTAFAHKAGVHTTALLCVSGGMIFIEFDLSSEFTNFKALLLMNSISDVLSFFVPESNNVWCRMTMPPGEVAQGALFTMAGVHFLRDVMMPYASILEGLEDRTTIVRELLKVIESQKLSER